MPEIANFNAEILASVGRLNAEWAARGYDINSHDLRYGPDCCIRANHPPLTMCVAAVAEVIIEALNARYEKTDDKTPFQKLPMRSWMGGTKRDIRPHILMYDEVKCDGTAHALERFGIGKVVPFAELEPGSFINFNRTASGHACVFLSYVDADGDDVAEFGDNVVG